MTSTPDSSEKPDKQEEIEDIIDDEILDEVNESLPDEPVLLEGEAVDVTDDLTESDFDLPEEDASETISESFPPAEPAPKKASIWPMLFGGLVAGALGFFAALSLIPGLSGRSDDVAQLTESIEGNATGLEGLSAEIATLRSEIPKMPEIPDTSGLEAQIAEVQTSVQDVAGTVSTLTETVSQSSVQASADLSALTEELSSLRERVAALEIDDGNSNAAQADKAAEQLSVFQADLENLVAEAEERIVAAEEKAQAVQAEAAAAAQAVQVEAAAAAEATEAEAARRAEIAVMQATLAELKVAVDAGAPFNELVAGFEDVPPELATHAETGVPTMVALQQGFAGAARSALATSQTVAEDASTGERFSAFLKRQTNARSLEPKDGDDADAVLSRAEALLSEGNLTETLSEVSVLPDAAKEAMSGWLTDAQNRQAALQAVDALSAKLN